MGSGGGGEDTHTMMKRMHDFHFPFPCAACAKNVARPLDGVENRCTAATRTLPAALSASCQTFGVWA